MCWKGCASAACMCMSAIKPVETSTMAPLHVLNLANLNCSATFNETLNTFVMFQRSYGPKFSKVSSRSSNFWFVWRLSNEGGEECFELQVLLDRTG